MAQVQHQVVFTFQLKWRSSLIAVSLNALDITTQWFWRKHFEPPLQLHRDLFTENEGKEQQQVGTDCYFSEAAWKVSCVSIIMSQLCEVLLFNCVNLYCTDCICTYICTLAVTQRQFMAASGGDLANTITFTLQCMLWTFTVYLALMCFFFTQVRYPNTDQITWCKHSSWLHQPSWTVTVTKQIVTLRQTLLFILLSWCQPNIIWLVNNFFFSNIFEDKSQIGTVLLNACSAFPSCSNCRYTCILNFVFTWLWYTWLYFSLISHCVSNGCFSCLFLVTFVLWESRIVMHGQ